LPTSIFSALKNINRFAPGSMLAIVNLTEVKDVSLNNTVVRSSLVLNDTPVSMFFAVLKPAFGSEKHGAIVQNTQEKSRG
jgi:hypothetical protein